MLCERWQIELLICGWHLDINSKVLFLCIVNDTCQQVWTDKIVHLSCTPKSPRQIMSCRPFLSFSLSFFLQTLTGFNEMIKNLSLGELINGELTSSNENSEENVFVQLRDEFKKWNDKLEKTKESCQYTFTFHKHEFSLKWSAISGEPKLSPADFTFSRVWTQFYGFATIWTLGSIQTKHLCHIRASYVKVCTHTLWTKLYPLTPTVWFSWLVWVLRIDSLSHANLCLW